MRTSQSRHSLGANRSPLAFSLIELIAAMSVVLALAIVAFAYASSYKSGVENTKRLGDIDALQNVANSYFKAKGAYPTPKANAIPYDKEGRYSHDTTPYGYSSFVSDDLFGADFLREVPRDPSTNSAYAYGKQNVSEESPRGSYDFATVDLNEGIYYAYVRGNYDGSRLTSLIRAYNAPEFVQSGTDKYLPYNPYEMKLTGRVTSYTGSVFVVHEGVTYGPPEVFTGELVQGDRVSTPAGSYATLHFADGSEVRLGSDSASGVLNIASLTYKDRSIATRLRLKLQEGSLWTNAPHLRDASEDSSIMEVETDSAVAAVRGTIFGVETSIGGKSTISIKDGVVGVYGVSSTGPEDTESESSSDASSEISGNGVELVTLTGGLGNYQMVHVSPSSEVSQVTSFTGGSISSEACGGSEYVNCGPELIKATGEWNNLLKSRKPDISTIERTSIGAVVVRVTVPEEDIGRWLCAGNATGDAYENFVDKMCVQMTASGSRVFGFEGSVAASIFTDNSQDSGFAICTHNFSSAGGNTCSVPRMITVGVEAFWPVRMDSQSLGCAEKDRFGTLGCLGEDTVAYAPYDAVGDLNMYYRQDDGKIGKLPVKTNGWLKESESQLSGTDIFGNILHYRKEFYSAGNSDGNGNITFTWPNGDDAEKGADNGVVIKTGAPNGYLAYDLSQLNLWDTFSIEVKVKGEALKRTDIDSHYIWDDGDGGVALYYDSDRGGVGRFILENRSANLFPIPTNNNCAIGSTTNKKYLCSNNNPAFFQDDKYYTLRTEFSKKTIRLYIDDTLVGNIESNDTKYFATKQILVGNRLYGGYVFQWDSSISSVKIRK